MSEPNTLHRDVASPQEASTLADLWVASYRFSQGAPYLQSQIVSYMCREVLPDSVREDEELLGESYRLAKAKIGPIVNSNGHTDTVRDIHSDVVESDFESNIINNIQVPNSSELEDLLEMVSRETLQRDATYLPANDYAHERHFGSSSNRYYSYAIRYIMLGATTGQPAYDQLFRDARIQLPEAAAKPITTYVNRVGKGLHPQVHNQFVFGDIAAQHREDDPSVSNRIAEAAAELEMTPLLTRN